MMRAALVAAIVSAASVSSTVPLNRIRGQAPSDEDVANSLGGQAVNLSYLFPQVWSRDSGAYAPSTCELPAGSGRANGICMDDVEQLRSQLMFCKEAVRYRACVPAHQPLWEGWNASKKDALLADLFKSFVERRIAQEANVTPDVYVSIHFMSNPTCIAQYRNILCWQNFPKCDDYNVSLPLCRKSCEKYYTSCLYEPDPLDGLHDACRQSAVASNGTFGSGIPGPDQRLADSETSCESTAALVASIPDEDPVPEWYETWWGLTLIVIGIILSIVFAAQMLLPLGLRMYISWALWRIFTWPHRMWKLLPIQPGWVVMGSFAVFFVILLAVGIIINFTGGDFDRFKRKSDWIFWYDASDGWFSYGDWYDAVQFCKSKQRRLCSRWEYCPLDLRGSVANGTKQGENWAPYNDEGDNAWVQIGSGPNATAATCQSYHQAKGRRPAWGLLEENNSFRNYIACCKAVKMNYYRKVSGVGAVDGVDPSTEDADDDAKARGGICICPDGKQYEVGDNGDNCGSLACEGGGVPGECTLNGTSLENAGMKVTCAAAFKPEPSIFEITVTAKLLRSQYKQVLDGCSCTGSTSAPKVSIGLGAAMVILTALALSVSVSIPA